MKKEIKFRAWDKKDKVMREVYGLQFPKISNHGNRDNTIIEMHCSDYEGSKAIILSDFTDNISRVELMQYTGLKDKNGTPIFEGDVVRTWVYHLAEDKEFPHNDRTKIVEWVESSKYTGWGIGKGTWEVIGNVWENPELLNKGEGEKGRYEKTKEE